MFLERSVSLCIYVFTSRSQLTFGATATGHYKQHLSGLDGCRRWVLRDGVRKFPTFSPGKKSHNQSKTVFQSLNIVPNAVKKKSDVTLKQVPKSVSDEVEATMEAGETTLFRK